MKFIAWNPFETAIKDEVNNNMFANCSGMSFFYDGIDLFLMNMMDKYK